MQQIDSKSLDLLFNNPAQEARQSFLDVNKNVMAELKKIGQDVASRIQNKDSIQGIKSTPVKEESFERTIKQKETDSDNKTKKKETQKKKDEDLVQINIATTQVLNDAELKLGLTTKAVSPVEADNSKASDLNFIGPPAPATNKTAIDPNFIGPPVPATNKTAIDPNFIGPPAPTTAEATSAEVYEEDLSDLNLNLLPFSDLRQELQALTAKAPEAVEAPVELKIEVLTEMTEALTDEVDNLTKSIANIDLSTDSGVEKILDLSNQIEDLSDINNALKAQLDKLKQGLSSDASTELQLDPEARTLIDSRLEKFIESYKELKASSSEVIDTKTEAQIQKETDYRTSINQNLGFKDRIEVLEFTHTQEKLDLAKEAKVSANEGANLLADIKSSGKFSGSGAGTNSGSGQSSQQDIIQGLQQANGLSRTMNSRSEMVGKPIQMERLPNFIAEKATQAPSGVKQELKIVLSPGDMGDIELNISKEGNKLDIKLMFSNEDAMKRVEHKMTELRVLLKSRGFESKIELSQTNTNTSANTKNQQNANQSQGSFNQAREEQKERFLDRPNWLDEDISSDEPSFEEAYEGIMN